MLAMGQHFTGNFLSYAMLAQIDPGKIVNYFSVQSCLLTVGQHYTVLHSITQFWLRQINTTLFSSEKMTVCRSSRSQMFFKIGVLKNFALFTGKHLCWSLSLTKMMERRAATLLKRGSNTGVFV